MLDTLDVAPQLTAGRTTWLVRENGEEAPQRRHGG